MFGILGQSRLDSHQHPDGLTDWSRGVEQRDRGLLLCGVGIALGAAGLASIATAVSIKLLAPERSGGEHAWALHMGVGQLTLTGDGPRDPAPRWHWATHNRKLVRAT